MLSGRYTIPSLSLSKRASRPTAESREKRGEQQSTTGSIDTISVADIEEGGGIVSIFNHTEAVTARENESNGTVLDDVRCRCLYKWAVAETPLHYPPASRIQWRHIETGDSRVSADVSAPSQWRDVTSLGGATCPPPTTTPFCYFSNTGYENASSRHRRIILNGPHRARTGHESVAWLHRLYDQ